MRYSLILTKQNVDGKLKRIPAMIMSLIQMSHFLVTIIPRHMSKILLTPTQIKMMRLQLVMTLILQTLLMPITLPRKQTKTHTRILTRIRAWRMWQRWNHFIKTWNVNRLIRLGCVRVVQKIILFVSNSAQKVWIRHISLSCDPVIWFILF